MHGVTMKGNHISFKEVACETAYLQMG